MQAVAGAGSENDIRQIISTAADVAQEGSYDFAIQCIVDAQEKYQGIDLLDRALTLLLAQNLSGLRQLVSPQAPMQPPPAALLMRPQPPQLPPPPAIKAAPEAGAAKPPAVVPLPAPAKGPGFGAPVRFGGDPNAQARAARVAALNAAAIGALGAAPLPRVHMGPAAPLPGSGMMPRAVPYQPQPLPPHDLSTARPETPSAKPNEIKAESSSSKVEEYWKAHLASLKKRTADDMRNTSLKITTRLKEIRGLGAEPVEIPSAKTTTRKRKSQAVSQSVGDSSEDSAEG